MVVNRLDNPSHDSPPSAIVVPLPASTLKRHAPQRAVRSTGKPFPLRRSPPPESRTGDHAAGARRQRRRPASSVISRKLAGGFVYASIPQFRLQYNRRARYLDTHVSIVGGCRSPNLLIAGHPAGEDPDRLPCASRTVGHPVAKRQHWRSLQIAPGHRGAPKLPGGSLAASRMVRVGADTEPGLKAGCTGKRAAGRRSRPDRHRLGRLLPWPCWPAAGPRFRSSSSF